MRNWASSTGLATNDTFTFRYFSYFSILPYVTIVGSGKMTGTGSPLVIHYSLRTFEKVICGAGVVLLALTGLGAALTQTLPALLEAIPIALALTAHYTLLRSNVFKLIKVFRTAVETTQPGPARANARITSGKRSAPRA